MVELKCVDRLTNEHNEHMAQCLNYLKVSKMTLCLLVNFQKPVVEWRRIVLNHPSSLYWAADERMINADKTKQDFLSDNSNLFRVEFLDMIASSFHDH